jgi:hypothetical protein
LPKIQFTLTGTEPRGEEVAELDLVNVSTAHSVPLNEEPVFGANEIDLNTDTAGVPPGTYAIRMTYSAPNGTLAATTVAVVSESFDIK